MIKIGGFNFKFEYSLLRRSQINSITKRLEKEIKTIKKRLRHSYSSNYSFLNLPFDKQQLLEVKKAARKYRNLDYVVVVGMGGSILGTMAIYASLCDTLVKKHPKLLFLDNIDSDKLREVLDKISKSNYLINVVSKSGNTTETIANFLVLIKELKLNPKELTKRVVITCDYNTRLYNMGLDMGLYVLGTQSHIGGRFSVFSSVGLFPLYLCGVNIDLVLLGARSAVSDMLSTKSPSALSAAILYSHLKTKNIHDTFLFDSNLESFGKWYRQLLAESTGKRGAFCYTPTVSIGSSDLHSIGQLYLGGPNDKFTTFVKVKKSAHDFVVPAGFDFIVEGVSKKKISQIRDFIYAGVKKAYIRKKMPFVEVVLEKKSEEVLGELMTFKMIETLFLGHLMGVNVFDQPAVELYKKETRRLLLKR